MTVARSRGGPPPLAVPLCQEVSPLTSWHAPRGAGQSHGDGGRPRGAQPTPATPRRHERGSAPQGRRRCCRADRIGRWEGRCSTGTPWWPSTPGPSARGALVRTWSTGSTPPRPRPSWRPTCSRPSAPAGSSSVPAGAPSVMPSASLMTDSLDFTPSRIARSRRPGSLYRSDSPEDESVGPAAGCVAQLQAAGEWRDQGDARLR